jgi:hypothetical protein
MSGGALLLNDTAIITDTDPTTVCTILGAPCNRMRFCCGGSEGWKQRHLASWFGPGQLAVLGVGADCSVGRSDGAQCGPCHGMRSWRRFAWPCSVVGAAVLCSRGCSAGRSTVYSWGHP